MVYAAAGGTGVGVLQAAADAGKLGIGVDSNQNDLHPGKVLTSMLKRVDVAVYNAFMDAKNGNFTAGINDLGLKEDGVGYAMDDNNKALVTPEMQAAAEKAKADIIAGTHQGARLHVRQHLPGSNRARPHTLASSPARAGEDRWPAPLAA